MSDKQIDIRNRSKRDGECASLPFSNRARVERRGLLMLRLFDCRSILGSRAASKRQRGSCGCRESGFSNRDPGDQRFNIGNAKKRVAGASGFAVRSYETGCGER